ncbi:CDP-diacylglycerol--glycerol-3-phosphate 3-phosphatidyltransferase [Pontiella sulfatireligans]|uniref:CDP-diacylglycerol--glycerol-3-phosphate 3-phosphatidyltransferase n=1 Tax=Pontiella sulfatireligans TaxID=2750658 RepID=A0A6C2UJW0_9BACT|nr:CDP-diacylglycerol--glycerol-3-phosphate 3-phosphatidyltransferase [Pontiella sulfatireligans]VGO20520.1 CDP-diacylglycerol--glycerol-3-phosphate 3-phosphatidyltransferase [Pontiella sulfatireligans]
MKSLPNHLTISRFWMTAVMMVCMSVDFPYALIVALGIFIVASITDALDGYLARNFFGCTSFGKLMDPLADKVLVCAAFIGFIELNSLSAWMVVLIIAREFMVTGMRLLMIEKGIVMPAGNWGKVKTTVQMLAICLLFFGLIWPEVKWFPTPGTTSCIPYSFAWWLGLGTALLTAWTGVVYFWQQRHIIWEKESEGS